MGEVGDGMEVWRSRRVLPPLSLARQASESAVSLRNREESKWWAVLVTLQPGADGTSALQAARDLYTTTGPWVDWSGRWDSHPRSLAPKASVLATTLRPVDG